MASRAGDAITRFAMCLADPVIPSRTWPRQRCSRRGPGERNSWRVVLRVDAGSTPPGARGPTTLRRQHREVREVRRRRPWTRQEVPSCRYDEAGVRLCVESPPAPLLYSRPVRTERRSATPTTSCRPAHTGGRRRRVGRFGDRGGQRSGTRTCGAADAAREAPRVQVGRTVRQSATRGPCRDVRTRSRDRHASAYADGSRARVHDDGCSAGTSACPWPRWYSSKISAVVTTYRCVLVVASSANSSVWTPAQEEDGTTVPRTCCR